MATTYKVLGQALPAVQTQTVLYTVTTGKQCVVSSLVICNQTSAAASYRIAVLPFGETLIAADKHWIVYGATVGASDTTVVTPGITLASGDKIYVYGSTATISFSVFGTEL
jgi:hypothetical protein